MNEQVYVPIKLIYKNIGASLVAQSVKNLPAEEIGVWSLGGEDPLEKKIANHCIYLPGKIPWTEEPGGLQYMGSQRDRHNWATNTLHFHKNINKCGVVLAHRPEFAYPCLRYSMPFFFPELTYHMTKNSNIWRKKVTSKLRNTAWKQFTFKHGFPSLTHRPSLVLV